MVPVRSGCAHLTRLLGWLAPKKCASCEAHLDIDDVLFCRACGLLSSPVPPGLVTETRIPLFSAYAYEGPVQKAVHAVKFSGRAALVDDMTQTLTRALGGMAGDLHPQDRLACVVPIPLHPQRLSERGFNQAALLAGGLARRKKLRFVPRCLQRVRYTEQQATLRRAQRVHNLAGAFHVRQVPPGPVLLVDDVTTTGSTLLAAARCLRKRGVHVVAAVTFARKL